MIDLSCITMQYSSHPQPFPKGRELCNHTNQLQVLPFGEDLGGDDRFIMNNQAIFIPSPALPEGKGVE